MILKEISDLIVVDQLNIENNEKYAFFISHPSEDLLISNNFKSRIYTSSHIGNIFATIKKNQIPMKCFKILRDGEKAVIHLSNGDNLIVTMFKDEEASRNVLYHFEINSSTAVYLGHFKQISKIMWKKTFLDLVSKGINYLYLDNTNSKSIYHSTEFEICYKFKKLLQTHTKIIINTPEFGYEDLIKTFVEEFNFKVFIKNDITRNMFYNTVCNGKFIEFKDSQIAMIKDSPNLEIIEKRLNSKKIATVRLFDFQQPFENKTYEKIGLYQFSYSSHISQMQMFTLISLIQPQYIKEIYPEFSLIPNFIKSASKRWNYVADEVDITDNLKIDNFAPKTQIKNSELLAYYIEGTVSENQSNANNQFGCISDKNMSDNASEKSTDCEEIYVNDTENLADKIKDYIPNIPRRKQIKETPIIIDSSPERYRNNIEKINKDDNRTDMENIKKTGLESKNIEENVNDEFATLVNVSKLSSYPISESELFQDNISRNQYNLNNENVQTDNKKRRESNENYFSFLDNNSLSSKKSNNSDDEKELKGCNEKNKVSKPKNDNLISPISFTQKITSEDLNNECPSSYKQNQLKNKTIAVSLLNDNMDHQYKRNSKENNEPLSQFSFNFTSEENIFNRIQYDCKNSKNEKNDSESLFNNKNIIKNKSSPVKKQYENEKINKGTVKDYNPFRKRSFKSDDDNESINKSKDDTNKSKVKLISKRIKNSTPIKNIETNNSNKRSNNNNKKDIHTSRKSSSSKKRRESNNSVQEIDDRTQDVIEIIDNSPPPHTRNTRRSAKIKLVEVRSKRRITKNQPISHMYIDDEDD